MKKFMPSFDEADTSGAIRPSYLTHVNQVNTGAALLKSFHWLNCRCWDQMNTEIKVMYQICLVNVKVV